MADIHSKRKRRRVDDNDSDAENDADEAHEDHRRNDRNRRRGSSSQNVFDRITADGHTRMHVGNHYGDLHVHHGDEAAASGSKSSEANAIESALESLMFDEMDSRYLTISSSLPSTCNWLFERKEFSRWQDVSRINEHHGFFWIKGKAGAGKSTLVKYICQKAKKNSEEHGTVVSFFFNARGAPIEKSLEGMYRSLLYQLLDKLPRLKALLDKRRAISALRQGWSLDLLQDVFRDLVENLSSDRLTCFVDALDECPEDDAKKMVSFFEELGELSVFNGIQLYVCFASRHYPRISIHKSEIIILEKSPGHRDDIAKYVRRKLKIDDRKLKQKMVEEIERRASGVFLWVELVVDILNGECDRGNVQEVPNVLKRIPRKIKNVIEEIVERGRSSKHLVPLLQWILFAKRPLSREELYLALQCVDGALSKEAHSESALSASNIDKFILDSSKGLAEMTKGKKPRVQFIHELVRTHFLDDGGLLNLEPSLRTDMVSKSHDQLRHCCSTYQLSEHCAQLQLPTPLPYTGSQKHKELRQSMIDAYPFLRYVVESALYHANEAQVGGVDQNDFVASFAHDVWATLHNVFATSKNQLSNLLSTAHVVASQGLPRLLEVAFRIVPVPDSAAHEWYYHLLSAAVRAKDPQSARMIVAQSSSDCHHDKDNGFLLWQAVSKFDLETVKAFLGAKLKPYNPRGNSDRQTALAVAALSPDDFGSELGSFGLLRLLIGHISDADARNRYCRFALTMALEEVCRKGDIDLSKELLAKGANAHGSSYCSPISRACTSGNQALVLLLIQEGVDLKKPRGKYVTAPLQAACGAGHEDIVRLLIREGLKVEDDPKALRDASEKGHETIVRFLLSTNPNNDKEALRAALEGASEKGHETIVRFLLSTNPNNDKEALRAALEGASRKGQEAIVRCLLQESADLSEDKKALYDALVTASRNGHESIVRCLLQESADLSEDKKALYDALVAASRNGHESIMRFLLTKGAELSKDNEILGHALRAACWGGHESIARLLLDMGADVRYGNPKSTRTALWYACREGHELIVRLLLEQGADVDKCDDWGQSPLSAAVQGNHEAAARLLIESEANINAAESNGTTTLWWACRHGNESLVRMLVEHGADINTKNNRDESALVVALCNKRNIIARLLVERGAIVDDCARELGSQLGIM